MSGPHLEVVPPAAAEVRLTLPVDADWLALARTTGASVAVRADFTYDEIADLRLAIDELCLSLIERHGGAVRIEIAYSVQHDELRVEVCLEGVAPGAPCLERPGQEFSERILDALVDADARADHEASAWFTKRRQRR